MLSFQNTIKFNVTKRLNLSNELYVLHLKVLYLNFYPKLKWFQNIKLTYLIKFVYILAPYMIQALVAVNRDQTGH